MYKHTCINSYYKFVSVFYRQESESGGKDGNKSTFYQNIESSVIYENDAYVLPHIYFL